MKNTKKHWLEEYAKLAEKSDRFKRKTDHIALLAAGLMGESGSILTELKKKRREQSAYPEYRRRMLEELGDFLWYYVRLVCVLDANFLDELTKHVITKRNSRNNRTLHLHLQFGAAVGSILDVVNSGKHPPESQNNREPFILVWKILSAISFKAGLSLQSAAESNIQKTTSRWPTHRKYAELFDDDLPEEDRLPRRLKIEFREVSRGKQKSVILRCNNINFGDRLTDNIEDSDGYRYHDIFHFAHVVHLGWSPVVRALLRCKRKSKSKLDEGQDGARAVILEEAVSAIVFSRAKKLKYFGKISHVDFDLLKTIQEFVQGYEVERIPLWQWEAAILDGYRIFRKLRDNRGGRVTLDLKRRELKFMSPKRTS